MTSHNAECNVRDEVEKQNSNLVDRHARIMEAVEALLRHMEPSAVKLEHPTVAKPEYDKLADQYAIVDDKAPKQEASKNFSAHFESL